MSALFLAHWLQERDAPSALAYVASSVYGVVAATQAAGTRELQLISAQDEIVAPTRRFAPEPL
jgi:pyridoxine kinase